MPRRPALDIDTSSPPFDRLKGIEWLAPKRWGRRAGEYARNHLFIAREKHNPVNVLVKVTSKPGLVYERDLDNEIRSLTTINLELPDSAYFPFVHDHGRLPDGRLYLITSLFDEFPLATIVDVERAAARLVTHLRIAIEISRALAEIHRIEIFHVDLNPMNVLYRMGNTRPVIRIVDFESSYERQRHADTRFLPPMTPGYSAPEVKTQAPDARADIFSLGAVLYTLIAGYRWTVGTAISALVAADTDLDRELRDILLSAVDPSPDKRYGSVLELQQALGTYLETIWPGRSW